MQLSRRFALGSFVKPQVARPGWMKQALLRASCRLWGHHVDNRVFRSATAGERHCRCGAEYLGEDRSVTRVRHTLKCFLRHHTYQRLIDRDGWHEYVCIVCGHPLLFREEHDPYDRKPQFAKKVRYLCGLFGHRVERVATRDGLVEYACFCGHSFLKAETALSVIKHPAVCVTSGHYLQFVTRRNGFGEYVCRNCGHPFCFADGQLARR